MDKIFCTERVVDRSNWHEYRCSKVAKHDVVDGIPTKCGIHCAGAAKKRMAKQDAKREAWSSAYESRRNLENIRSEIEALVREIAVGHNDPRGAAQDIITRLDEARSKLST